MDVQNRSPENPAPADDIGESRAHHMWNQLIQAWTVLYVALPLLAVMSSHSQGAAGLLVGLTGMVFLFVPWLVGTALMLVLRSTTRSH